MGVTLERDLIFISYRRSDQLETARALTERLADEFRPERVFFDMATIPLGRPFPPLLERQLDRARVVLALIGPGWLTAHDEWGSRRIDLPDDWVRRELAYALSTDGVDVIPVLTDDTLMPPRAARLPEDLAAISDLNAAQLRSDAADMGLAPLIARLRELVVREEESSGPGTVAVGPKITVPHASRSMIPRPELTTMIMQKLTGADGRVALLSVSGAGGVGKTVLAQQVGRHRDLARGFPGGIFWVPVGENASAEEVALLLYLQASGERPPAAGMPALLQLEPVLSERPGRSLVIFDDVWDPELLDGLLASLPAGVAVLYTTRGVEVAGIEAVRVEALEPGEARLILLGDPGTQWSADVLDAADRLADLLSRWALLVAMASAHLAPLLRAPESQLIEQIETIAAEFSSDPTALDDRESRTRSFRRMIQRSLDALGPTTTERFAQLAVYPPDALLFDILLADLWNTTVLDAQATARQLSRAGLATLTVEDGFAIALHDIVVEFVHLEHGRPGTDVELHRRCVSRMMDDDGQSTELTVHRARWLAFHLLASGDWARLDALAGRRWRNVYLQVNGSDSVYLQQLSAYGAAALEVEPASIAAYHAVRARFQAAYVYALVANTPIPLLVAQALHGNNAAITQAAHHPDAGRAIDRITTALGCSPRVMAKAVEASDAIGDPWVRASCLAQLADRVTAADADSSAEPVLKLAIQAARRVEPSMQRAKILGVLARLTRLDNHHRAMALFGEASALLADHRARGAAAEGWAKHAAALLGYEAAACCPHATERVLQERRIADRLGSTWLESLGPQLQADVANWRPHLLGSSCPATSGDASLVEPACVAQVEQNLSQHSRGQSALPPAVELVGILRLLHTSSPGQVTAFLEPTYHTVDRVTDKAERAVLLLQLSRLASKADPALAGACFVDACHSMRASEPSLPALRRFLAFMDPACSAVDHGQLRSVLRAAAGWDDGPEELLAVGLSLIELDREQATRRLLSASSKALASASTGDMGVLVRAAVALAPLEPEETRTILDHLRGVAQHVGARHEPNVRPQRSQRSVVREPGDWEAATALATLAEIGAHLDPGTPGSDFRLATEAADVLPPHWLQERTCGTIAKAVASVEPHMAESLALSIEVGSQLRDEALADVAEGHLACTTAEIDRLLALVQRPFYRDRVRTARASRRRRRPPAAAARALGPEEVDALLGTIGIASFRLDERRLEAGVRLVQGSTHLPPAAASKMVGRIAAAARRDYRYVAALGNQVLPISPDLGRHLLDRAAQMVAGGRSATGAGRPDIGRMIVARYAHDWQLLAAAMDERVRSLDGVLMLLAAFLSTGAESDPWNVTDAMARAAASTALDYSVPDRL